MNLQEIIQQLREEKARIERTLAALEELAGTAFQAPASTHRRGRKSMNAAERLEVSKRMKKYWAARRKNQS